MQRGRDQRPEQRRGGGVVDPDRWTAEEWTAAFQKAKDKPGFLVPGGFEVGLGEQREHMLAGVEGGGHLGDEVVPGLPVPAVQLDGDVPAVSAIMKFPRFEGSAIT